MKRFKHIGFLAKNFDLLVLLLIELLLEKIYDWSDKTRDIVGEYSNHIARRRGIKLRGYAHYKLR